MKTLSFPHRAGHRGLIPIRPADNARSNRARRLDAIFRAASQCVEALESRTLLSSVSGTVYNDLNLSGSRNTSDPGLAGIQVFDDLNDTGQYQTGDPSAVTASDGSYEIYHVPLNTPQIICVTPPTGWDASPADDSTTSVTLTSAAPRVSGIDLGLWQPIESLSVQDIDLNEGQAFTGSVATVTDSAGGYANPYDYSGTLTLNGTSAVGFALDSDGNLVGQPAIFPNLSAGTYGATVDVTESDNGRSFNDSAQFTVTINEVPISAQGVTSSAQTGIAWSGTIATFTDPDPNAQASNYTATIDYGDGDEASVGTISSDGNGGWLVTDTHTFTSDGNFAPVVTINDLAASNDVAVATSAIAVALAPLSLNTQDIEFEEDVSGSWNNIIGTLTDSAGAYATGNYSGTLTIDGSTCTNMMYFAQGNGAYSLEFADFPALSPGSYSATLNITETDPVSTVSTGPSTFTVTVDDAPFTSVAGGDISADVGVPWTGTVATFDHFDYNPQASNYSATIDYPGGTAAGTISSDGSGGWIVTASLTFPDPGNPATTVTINDNGGGSTSIGDGVAINFDPLSLSASNLYLEQGQPYSGTVGVLTDAAGFSSNGANFSATLIWNGWIYGNLTLTPAGAGDGVWDLVAPGLAGLPAGTYTESLSVTETDYTVLQTMTTDPVNFTANIISPSLYASGGYISATVGQSWSGTLANVTDDDPYDQPNIYDTASTNYGDDSAPTDSQISAGSTSWTVSDTHTFISPGVFAAYTTIFDSNGNDIAGAGNTANVNLAPISLTTPDAWLTEGQSFSSPVGYLTDQAGNYASGNYSGSLTVTNDATSASQTYALGFPDGGSVGLYYVEASGLPALSGGSYTAALQVSESAGDGQTVDASSDFAINVATLPITLQSGTISPNMGVSWSGAVATFTDPDPNASPGNYSVSINYGDGTAASAGTVSSDGNGGWIISGTHTFSSVGVVSPTVTLTDNTVGGVYSTTDSASVSPAPIYLNASDQQVQMGSQSVIVDTLTDTAGAYASGNYVGTISVNGGYPQPVSFIADGSNDGGFLVQAYGLSTGNYQVTVTAAEYIGGMSVDAPPATFNVDVTDSPISAQGQNIGFAAQGPWTGTVATFTQPNPNALAGNYTATISDQSGSWWGNIDSDGNGGWIVTGTLGYSTPGYYSPTVTISDNAGGSTSVTDSVAVNLAGLSLNASNLYLAQGESYTGVIGTVTDAAGYYSNPANYSASLTWADGSTNTDLTFAPDGPGQWDVMASSLPILPGGQGSASLVVTESAGNESNVVTADFSVATLLAQGVIINATVNTPWYGTIATLSDTDPADQPYYYTASTEYGDSFDGTPTAPSTGDIWQGSNNDWIVTDTHTFVSGGTYSPTTTLTDVGSGATASASSYASVNLAPITLSTSNFWTAAGAQWYGGAIGTLSDAAGPYAAADYSGSVSFSDNPGVSSPVSFSPDGNNDGGYSMVFFGTVPLSNGWHIATLLVSETSADQTQSIEATSNFAVHVGPDPMYVASDTPVTMNGTTAQPITGTLLHFTDSDPEAQSSDYYATVDWGDGTTEYANDPNSSISVQPDPSGVGFDVVGSHAYAMGDYSASIMVGAGRDFNLTNNINVDIADTPLAEMSDSPITISALEGQPTINSTLFHFTDSDPNATLGTFSASITWGDGSSNTTGDSTGDLTLAADPSGGFDVIGTHTYTSPGNFAVDLVVQHNAGASLGASLDASLTATIAPITSTFTATPVNTGAIDLEWWLGVDPSTVSNIELDRSTSPTSGFAPVPAAQYLPGDSISYMDDAPPLAEGTHYYYELQVTTPYGTCTSPVVDAWTAPSAPTSLTALAAGSTEVDLSWTNTSGDALGFQIQRTDANGNQTTTTISGSYAVGATVSYADTTVFPDSTYIYQVQTIGDGGPSNPPTVGDPVTTGPVAPTSLIAAAVSASEIDLSWTNSVSSYDGIEVDRSTSPGGPFVTLPVTLSPGTIIYHDTSVAAGTTYYYDILALENSAASIPSNVASGTTLPVTSSFTPSTESAGQISLGWSLAVTDATSIEVDRSTSSSGPFTPILTNLPGDATSYTDTDPALTAGTEYYYQLTITQPSGTSVSPVIGAWTAPAAPSNLSAQTNAQNANEIDLTWTSNSSAGTLFYVERAISGTGQFTLLNSSGTSSDSYPDDSAVEGMSYDYEVYAEVGGAESAYSNTATVAVPPSAPSDLELSNDSDGNVVLSWTNNSQNATGIEVERMGLVSGSYETIAILNSSATTFTDDNGVPGASYYYQLIATTSASESIPCQAIDPNTESASAGTFGLHAPSNLTATADPSGGIDLSWENNSPDAGDIFDLERSTNASGGFESIGPYYGYVYGTTFVDDNTFPGDGYYTAPGTAYYYRVSQYGSLISDTEYSNVASAITLPQITAAFTNPGFPYINVYLNQTVTLVPDVVYDSGNLPYPITGWTINWGDGSAPQNIADNAASPTTSFNYSYAQTGNYNISIVAHTQQGDVNVQPPALDEMLPNGLYAHAELQVDVAKQPVTISTSDTLYATANSTFTLPITVDNPDGINIDGWAVDWGDGSPISTTTGGTTPSFNHTYGWDITYNLVLTCFTDIGAVVLNAQVNPGAGFSFGYSGTAGQPVNIDAYYIQHTDSYVPTLDYTIDWGDNAQTTVALTNIISSDQEDDVFEAHLTASHTYAQDGAYETISTAEIPGSDSTPSPSYATEEIGGWATPSLNPIPDQVAITGSTVQVSTTFVEADNGPSLATIDWNDGRGPQPAEISGDQITADLQNAPAGLTDPIVTVFGDDGQSASQQFQLTVDKLVVTAPADAPMDQGASGAVYYNESGDLSVPDFANGYGLNPSDPNQSTYPTAPLSPVAIQIPYYADVSDTLTIAYDASNPADVTFTGNGTTDDPYVYSLPAGDDPYRLWTSGSNSSQESLLDVVNSGQTPTPGVRYYVPPGTYPLSAFGWTDSSSDPGDPSYFSERSITLYLEAVKPTQGNGDDMISATLDPSDSTQPTQDASDTTDTDQLDLLVDSTNTVQPGSLPTSTPDLEQIKDDPTKPGKVIVVNDAEQDGVPAFASGYTMDPAGSTDDDSGDNAPNNEYFVPLVVNLPDDVDLSQTSLTFTYSASDPGAVIRPDSSEPNIGYTPGPGSLRIWTEDGTESRNGNPLQYGGDFVQSGIAYTASQLQITNSSSDGPPSVTLYVEAVSPSVRLGDLQIQVGMVDASSSLIENDAVRLTAIQDTPMSYGSSANVLLGDASGSDGGDPMSNNFDGAVNLADGTVSTPAVTDLSSSGFGQNFGMTRVWTDRLVDQLTPGDIGNGWIDSDLPTLVNATGTIIANIDGNSSLYFDVVAGQDGGASSYKARFFSQEQLSYDSSNDLYTLTDTVGDQFVFYGFGSSLDSHQRGQLKSYTSAAGNQITFNYADSDSDWPGSMESVTRTDGTVTETWSYAYNAVDPNNPDPDAPYQLSLLTLSRSGGNNAGVVDQVAYTYYGDGDSNGMKGNLETAQLQDPSGNPLATYYYRYFVTGANYPTDETWGLMLAVGPSGYERFEGDFDESPRGAADADLQPYADYYLGGIDEYGGVAYYYGGYSVQGQVNEQWIGGQQSEESYDDNSTAMAHTYTFASSGSGAVGMNVWTNSTFAELSDSTETIYSNYAGEVMLNSVGPVSYNYYGVLGPANPSSAQNTAYIYDNEGRLTLQASPSAVGTFDPDAPDLFDKTSDGTYQFLSNDTGLINETVYSDSASSTTQPLGYAIQTDALHGDQALGTGDDGAALSDGADDPISTTMYTTAGDGDGPTAYLVASQTQYAGTDFQQPQVTSYSYPAWNNLSPAEIITTPPIVPTSEDGTGTAQPSTAWYDQYGNVQWMQDPTGQIEYAAYDDGTGAQTLDIVDADPANMPDGIAPPSGLTRPTTLPAAQALTTTAVVDNLGRPISVTDADGNVTTYSYYNSQSESKVTTTPPSGPVQVTDDNLSGGWIDSLTETVGGTIESLTRQYLDLGGNVATTDSYSNLSGLAYSEALAGPFGTQNTNYQQTTDDFVPGEDISTDDLGNSTITEYNASGEPTETESQIGGNIPVFLETDQYNADGDLIQTTDYPGGGEAPQVTDILDNWQDEQVATESGVGTATNQISFNVLNNLGQPTTEEEFSGKNVTFADDSNGEPQVPSGAQLVAETQEQTDPDGDDDSSEQMSVSPTTGAVSGGQTTQNWYDADGNVVASEDPNGVWTKTVYNDAGEASAVYTTDGGGDNPFTVDGDVVSSQQEFQYDDDGNTILTTTRTRLTTALSSDTGALDGTDSTVDYVADYYDSDDRLTDEADFGNNGGTAMTAPPALADVPAPGASPSVLVTHTDYDADGNVLDTIDPTGTETHYSYDDLGDVTQEIDNYNPSINGGNPTGEANLTTDYTYDGDGNVLTVEQVAPSGQVNETTQYVYGTGPTAGDVVQTENPDPVTGNPSVAADEDESETFDNLGNVLSETSPDGEVQTFTYNALDQMTLNAITTLGSGEDGLVRATGYTFAPDGQLFQQTDFSNPAATTIVDQTQDVYDGYGNEIGEYDSQQGPVDTATTPETTETPNADGEDTGSSDPLGDADQNTYQGGTLTQTNQSGHDIPAQYNYDPVTGNLSSLNLYQSGTVGSGTPETTTWKYDPASGQILNETFDDGTQDNYTYNGKQQLSTETKPGETIIYGYDTAGDQTSSTAADTITGTTVTDTSTYDSNGMLSTVSQTTSGATTSSASNTFSYTAQGNVASESQTGGVTTQYTYFGDSSNNPGAVQSMKLVNTATGATLSETDYAYNSAQQLSSITVNGQASTYTYQTGTNLIASVTTGGVTTTYGYDPDTGSLTSINTSNGSYSATFSYNANNQRTSQTVSQTNSDGSTTSQNYTYTYDNANELATVTSGGSTIESYSYDGAGNRTDAAFVTQYGTANSMNEYSGITYNARGDVTNDGTNSYVWNANDQLTSVTADNNSVRVTLQYDGQGRLIEKDDYTQTDGAWTLSSTRKYVYEGTQLSQELDGNNNLITGYTWGPQGLDAVTDFTGTSPKTYKVILDGSGNVAELIDPATGAVVASYTYTPYRALLTSSGPAQNVSDVLGGQGITDRSVQINIFGARVEAWAGFWLSQDPTGVAGGLNTFVYCDGDPINENDSSGLDPASDDLDTPSNQGPAHGIARAQIELLIHMYEAQLVSGSRGATGVDYTNYYRAINSYKSRLNDYPQYLDSWKTLARRAAANETPLLSGLTDQQLSSIYGWDTQTAPNPMATRYQERVNALLKWFSFTHSSSEYVDPSQSQDAIILSDNPVNEPNTGLPTLNSHYALEYWTGLSGHPNWTPGGEQSRADFLRDNPAAKEVATWELYGNPPYNRWKEADSGLYWILLDEDDLSISSIHNASGKGMANGASKQIIFISGHDDVGKLWDRISFSADAYPYAEHIDHGSAQNFPNSTYQALGNNSNTFVRWVLAQVQLPILEMSGLHAGNDQPKPVAKDGNPNAPFVRVQGSTYAPPPKIPYLPLGD